MSGLPAIALTNAASAAVLALLVAGASRIVRRPEIVHGLWLLVLLDLLTPPVVVIRVLPSFDSLLDAARPAESRPASGADDPGPLAASAGTRAPVTGVRSFPVAAAPASGELSRGADVLSTLGLLWWTGSASVLLLGLARGWRFERRLSRSPVAPRPIQERTGALARALGMRRVPRVRLMRDRVSPMLWFRPGRLELVFPARLLPRLERAELDALLGHELAHVRRGDHWVRWIELAASAVFFWHPVVWWARAEMRRAEEAACDAWVGRVLPAHARDYAAGLIKTLEFLAPARRPVPALASGVGNFRRLEERLTMILTHRTPPPTSRAVRMLLSAGGLALLLVFPGAAGRSAQEADDPDTKDPRSAEETTALESELRDLQRRQIEVSSRLRELHRATDEERMQQEIERLEAQGRDTEARRLASEAQRAARQADVAREHEQLDRARGGRRRARAGADAGAAGLGARLRIGRPR